MERTMCPNCQTTMLVNLDHGETIHTTCPCCDSKLEISRSELTLADWINSGDYVIGPACKIIKRRPVPAGVQVLWDEDLGL